MTHKLPEKSQGKLPGECPQSNTSFVLLEFLTQKLPRLFLATTLFLGGIFLISLRIPGWSLILGLPATQIGLIFLIFTFDEIARRRLGPESLHLVSCSVCGQPTLTRLWQEEKICGECQKKIAQKLKLRKS